jgi:hypothetical protein
MYKRDGYFVHPGMASEPLDPPEFHNFRNSPPSGPGEVLVIDRVEKLSEN